MQTNDNVIIGGTSSQITLPSQNVTIGSLNVSFVTQGQNTGSLTIPGIGDVLQAKGAVTLRLGPGSLLGSGRLDVHDSAADNYWYSGNLGASGLGNSGDLQIDGNSTMYFQRDGTTAQAPTPGNFYDNLCVGSGGLPGGSGTGVLIIGDLNNNIVVPTTRFAYVFTNGSLFMKTTNTSAQGQPFFFGPATAGTSGYDMIVDGKVYRDGASNGSSFTLSYDLKLESGAALEIYDAGTGVDELDITGTVTPTGQGQNVYNVWNNGGTLILGNAPDPNRNGTAKLVVPGGLYQNSGHLETQGTHTETLAATDPSKGAIMLVGGDMTFSQDNPTALGSLKMYCLYLQLGDYGGSSFTWNWYGTSSTAYDQLFVYGVNPMPLSGFLVVIAGDQINCHAPSGQHYTDVIDSQGYTDGNPTNFTLTTGFTGTWHTTTGNCKDRFEIDS
jgi:hypothetical protein